MSIAALARAGGFILGLAVLCAGGPVQARDMHGEGAQDPYGTEEILDYLPLRTATNDRVRVEAVLVLTDGGVFRAILDRNVVQRSEDRIGIIADIPLIGGLFTPRLREHDFQPGAQVGAIYLFGRTLVVETRRAPPPPAPATTMEDALGRLLTAPPAAGPLTVPAMGAIRTVSTANQKDSFHVSAGGFQAVQAAPGLPILVTEPSLAPARVGEAYRKDPDLLLLVRPSILTGWQ